MSDAYGPGEVPGKFEVVIDWTKPSASQIAWNCASSDLIRTRFRDLIDGMIAVAVACGEAGATIRIRQMEPATQSPEPPAKGEAA